MSDIEFPEAYNAAVKARIVANARKTWTANTPDHESIEAFLYNSREVDDHGRVTYSEGFTGSLAHALDTYGKLTEKQVSAVRATLVKREQHKAEWADARAAADAKSEWVGVIGKRVEMVLKVNHIVTLDGIYGTSWLFICVDANGNKVIYKGTSGDFPNKGETATVVATIKDHGVRDGAKQTVISRPRVLSINVDVKNEQ